MGRSDDEHQICDADVVVSKTANKDLAANVVITTNDLGWGPIRLETHRGNGIR